MKNEIALKTGLTGLTALITYYTNNLTSLVWLLVIFETFDYVTGIASALKTRSLASKEALWGFIKKLCYFFLVGVGFGIDYLIVETIGITWLESNYPAIFGVFCVCYLLSTEAISILENLSELGIEVPFLSKFLKTFRDKMSDNRVYKE